MSETLPMYPLDQVVFPGTRLDLHVTDDRYRALVHHLLRVDDPAQRLLGSVAIREGYELGDHGAQSLFRVGVRLQLTEASPRSDGSFDVEVLGRDRIQLDRLLTTGPFPMGEVRALPEPASTVHEVVLERARATYVAYRFVVADLLPFVDDDALAALDSLPGDAEYLSWSIAAGTSLPLGERQRLLEATDAQERLALATDLVREELAAMNVIASLPATEVARTRWSPN